MTWGLLATFGWRVVIFTATCAGIVLFVGTLAWLFVFKDATKSHTDDKSGSSKTDGERKDDPIPA